MHNQSTQRGYSTAEASIAVLIAIAILAFGTAAVMVVVDLAR